MAKTATSPKSKSPPKTRRADAKEPGPAVVLNEIVNIPFDKLRPSERNVRRIKNGVSIDDLAEDIGRRGLLQSLSVRAMLNPEGVETGFYEVQAGGRRFKALERLLKQKRLPADTPVPCIVRAEGLAEEDSLVENTQREALHPLDQFRAFQALRDQGLSDGDIAARFFVDTKIVRQRLKLAAASPKLLDLYVKDELSLDQLMAFCVTSDHKRQESVWKAVKGHWDNQPHAIRRRLTETTVPATDRRACFVGIEAYEAAGGVVSRDLFSKHEDGYLENPDLLDTMAAEKLATAAETKRRDEGWAWCETAIEFDWGHHDHFTRIKATIPRTTKKDEKARKALEDELNRLAQDTDDDGNISPETELRIAAIEAELETFDERGAVYDPEEKSHAGIFVSLDDAGGLRVERGYLRLEDDPDHDAAPDDVSERSGRAQGDIRKVTLDIGAKDIDGGSDETEEDEGVKPLSQRLMTELSHHRTLALRDAIASNHEVAYLAVLHALVLNVFHRSGFASCLDIEAKSVVFGQPAPGLTDTASAKAIAERHESWGDRLPGQPEHLWDALTRLDADEHADLFAHCVGLTVNAAHDPWSGRVRGLVHAGQLAQAVALDMTAAGWTATAENYLGRVPKARIIEAVTEAKGEDAAKLIAHLKKGDMAREAERMLVGANWLPEPLRTPGEDSITASVETEADAGDEDLPDFLAAE